ncbi:hypothetical protein Bbelb_069310 [Branchiostoma belcheri]|nr:hypothetical protein Bbelb_069310 [Branchiostoma belcheri]
MHPGNGTTANGTTVSYTAHNAQPDIQPIVVRTGYLRGSNSFPPSSSTGRPVGVFLELCTPGVDYPHLTELVYVVKNLPGSLAESGAFTFPRTSGVGSPVSAPRTSPGHANEREPPGATEDGTHARDDNDLTTQIPL